jgi:AbrB family looped-hinge helix DNA binding protein
MLRSKVTKQSQVNIPKLIREILHITTGDFVGYELRGKEVVLTKLSAPTEHIDPAISALLLLLERDISEGTVSAVTEHWVGGLRELVKDVHFEPNENLEGAISLA